MGFAKPQAAQYSRGFFALRSRRRLSIAELAPNLLPDVPRGETAHPLDWAALFGNEHPVEIEVGFGKGLFLLNAGASRPDINFFGIEIERKCQLFTATRLVQRQIPNVKIACGDARLLLRDRVPPASVQALHVYFPDPWWKKRHHKRRLFTPDFAVLVGRVLRVGGHFYVVTDVEEYFGIMMMVVNDSSLFEPLPPPAPTAAQDDLDYLTNFERKFRKEGRPIYRAAFVKK